MSDQVKQLSRIAQQEKYRRGQIDPRRQRRRALLWLVCGMVAGVTAQVVYKMCRKGVRPDPFLFGTAIASAIVMLALAKTLGEWLDHMTPWWAKFLLGFSLGFLA